MKRFMTAVVAVAVVSSWAAAAVPKTREEAGKAVAKETTARVQESAVSPIGDTWAWPAAMREVTSKFKGTEGVVVHIGDSITYANPYGGWARGGAGKSESDKKILQWMHTGANNDLDGWYLASFDVKDRNGSYTAVSGMRLDQALAGGFHGLPAMAEILKKYNPQIVIFMLGTNDASAKRPVSAFKADLEKAIQLILDNDTILVLSTIPPHINQQALGKAYNEVIAQSAAMHKLPLIDLYGEIVSRRPGMNWNGTLLNKGDVHPSASYEGASPSSEPTKENLSKSGYLLRGWLSVQKIKQVKEKVGLTTNKETGRKGDKEKRK